VLGAECHLESDPTSVSTSCADPDRAAEAVGELTRAGIGVANFSLGQPSLDEVFLALTGRPAEDSDIDAASSQANLPVGVGRDGDEGRR
jgi:ABC-2 type transport system ATP-binding protein